MWKLMFISFILCENLFAQFFFSLSFQFYIGGVPNKQEGLTVMQNFTGCMENLYLNTTNVINSVKEAAYNGESYLYKKVHATYSCPVSLLHAS